MSQNPQDPQDPQQHPQQAPHQPPYGTGPGQGQLGQYGGPPQDQQHQYGGPPPGQPTPHGYAPQGQGQYGGQPPYGQGPYGQQPYGRPPYGYPSPYPEQKSRILAGLLGLFFGGFGVHRFYLGHTGLGVAQIIVTFVTFGVGWIWGFIEGIMILAGAQMFRCDARGIPLKE